MRRHLRRRRGHLDHTIDHVGAEESCLHPGGVVEVERHPAEVALAYQAVVRARRLTLQQCEVAGELPRAEIGAVETLTLRRAAPRNLQMLLHGLGRIGAALRRQINPCLDDIGHVLEQGRGALLPVFVHMERQSLGRARAHGRSDLARRNLRSDFVATQ